jgi:hypothetical protein
MGRIERKRPWTQRHSSLGLALGKGVGCGGRDGHLRDVRAKSGSWVRVTEWLVSAMSTRLAHVMCVVER